MNDTVFVIGSNSFSGSHYIDMVLDQGFQVIGISRSEETADVFLPYKWSKDHISGFTFFQYDINHDFDLIAEKIMQMKPGYIVNFAAQGMVAQSWDNPEQWFSTNTVSHIKLHHFLKDCSFLKKYVHISTPEVYGSCTGYVAENVNYNPSTPYAVSKTAADLSLMTFHRQYGFPVVFIRSANVYGPGQLLYRIIPRAVLFFLMGRTIELHGGGKSVRSFIHIKDVCNGIFKAMTGGIPGDIFHLATADDISIYHLVQKVAEKTGVCFDDLVKTVGERPGKDNAYLLDCSKAKNQLGWKDKILLDDGIEDVILWVKKNMQALEKESFDYIHKP